jgi:hypothetical protein
VNSEAFSLSNYQDLRIGLSATLNMAGGGQEDFTAQFGAAPVRGPIAGVGLPGLIRGFGRSRVVADSESEAGGHA